MTSAPQLKRCCLVQVEDFAADLIGEVADAAAGTDEGEADVVLAEDVGVVGGDAAADTDAELAPRRRRWSEVRCMRREVRGGSFARGTTVFAGRSLLGRLAQIRRDLGAGARGAAEGRPRAASRSEPATASRRRRSLRRRRELVDVVVVVLVERERDLARARWRRRAPATSR